MLETGASQLHRSTSRPGFRILPLRSLFNRQYWWASLVVLLGMAFMARLGIWQLDRLEQRKARNAEIVRQLELPPLSLTEESLPEDLDSLETRHAAARGEFDFAHQVALLYQNRMDVPGIHLITPLVVENGSRAVLVDRGWLPIDQADPQNWPGFDEPGTVSVTGLIRLSQTLPDRDGDVSQPPVTEPQSGWYRVDIEALQAQMPYELLPVYLMQSPPEGTDTRLPYEVPPELDLSNGPHLGYAIQWFAFALILGIIYVRYVSQREASQAAPDADSPGAEEES